MTDQPRSASLAEALVQLQASLPTVLREEAGQFGKYADLANVSKVVLPALAALGLLWTCRPTMIDGAFVLAYRLEHADTGEWIDGQYPLASGNPQVMGGQITYARRYALLAVTGVAPESDDDDATLAAHWTPPANPSGHKAQRHHAARSGPLPDDEFTNGTASITSDQERHLADLFKSAGIEPDARLNAARSMLDLPRLGNARDLSYAQAEDLKRQLRELLAEQEAGA